MERFIKLARDWWRLALLGALVLCVFLPLSPSVAVRDGGWWNMGVWALAQPVSVIKTPDTAAPKDRVPNNETPGHHLGARLDVQSIRQLPQLINGCEATSLAIVLNYLGYGTTKMEIAYNFMPSEPFVYTDNGRTGGDPAKVYPGDPGTLSGYYCFPPVVAEAANLFLAYQAAPLCAQDITGAQEEDLLGWLDAGLPLIVWRTIDRKPLYTSAANAWYLPSSDELYEPYMNMHVAVLAGYDDDNFYLVDPLGLQTKLSRVDFMKMFEMVGRRAVVISEGMLWG